MSDNEPRGEYVPALVIESKTTPQQRKRNYALYSRLYYGVPPEERTGESREGIGLHVFQFAVPIEDVSVGMREVSFRLKRDGECLRRLCSYISDHFDSKCDADDEVARLQARVTEVEAELLAAERDAYTKTELVKAADLVHIRLRDGVRRAAERLESIAITTTQHDDYHDDEEWLLAAELRKLVL